MANGIGESYSFETWSRDFHPTWNSPSRVGVYDEPKRTAIVRRTFPSTTQRIVLLDLSTHIARPVWQRESSGASVEVLPGSLLASSSAVGIRVMPCSRFSV